MTREVQTTILGGIMYIYIEHINTLVKKYNTTKEEMLCLWSDNKCCDMITLENIIKDKIAKKKFIDNYYSKQQLFFGGTKWSNLSHVKDIENNNKGKVVKWQRMEYNKIHSLK